MTTELTPEQDAALDEIEQSLTELKTKIDNNAPSTLVSFVVDKSGSMSEDGKDKAVIEGFDRTISEQKAVPGECWVSLSLFDTKVTVPYVGVPLKDVQSIALTGYRPGGGTAMLDAIGITVQRTEDWIEGRTQKPDKVLIVIMTDGEENSSRDFDGEQIRKLVSKKTEEGWDFAYMGANQDAILAAEKMNIRREFTTGTVDTAKGASSTYAAFSDSLTSYRGAAGRSTKLFASNTVAEDYEDNRRVERRKMKPKDPRPKDHPEPDNKATW